MSFSKLNNGNPGVSKWHMLFAAAGVAAISAGLYYYILNNKSSKKADDEPKKEDQEIIEEETVKDEDIAELTPAEQAQNHKLEGNTHYKSGNFEEAIRYYTMAMEVCPSDNVTDLATYFQNRAAAYEQLKNWEKVVNDCTAALNCNGRYVKALSRRGKACEILTDLEQSLEDLTAVCILESFTNEVTLTSIDRVLKTIGKKNARIEMKNKKPVKPTKHFIKAYFESFAEDPLMEKEIVGTVENGTSVPISLYQEAKEYLADYNIEKVISCCTAELSNQQSDCQESCLLMRGTMYILKAENSKAFNDMDKLIDMPNLPIKIHTNALIKRGILHMQHEEDLKAIADIEAAVLLNPKSADACHHKGQILLLLGKIAEAMVDFEKATQLNSNFAVALVQKSYTDFRCAIEISDRSKIEGVKRDFEATIERFPECSECYMLYAQILAELNEFDKANEMYDKLELVDPSDPTVFVHRAMLELQSNGELKKAKQLIEKAIDMDDTCQIAYENLATIEVQLGHLNEGVLLFEKAINLAKTIIELTHLCSLRDAAKAQVKVVNKLGIVIPNIAGVP